MKNNIELKEFVVDQLAGLEGISARNMFGGVGFFYEKKMFGMIGGGAFRLKVNESNLQKYSDAGMENFNPYGKGKGLPYYEVPSSVIENQDELLSWVQESIEIALS